MGKTEKKDRLSFASAMFSAFAALFGVQSQRNYKQDFQQNSALPFIIAGIISFILFIGVLVIAVNLAVS